MGHRIPPRRGRRGTRGDVVLGTNRVPTHTGRRNDPQTQDLQVLDWGSFRLEGLHEIVGTSHPHDQCVQGDPCMITVRIADTAPSTIPGQPPRSSELSAPKASEAPRIASRTLGGSCCSASPSVLDQDSWTLSISLRALSVGCKRTTRRSPGLFSRRTSPRSTRPRTTALVLLWRIPNCAVKAVSVMPGSLWMLRIAAISEAGSGSSAARVGRARLMVRERSCRCVARTHS